MTKLTQTFKTLFTAILAIGAEAQKAHEVIDQMPPQEKAEAIENFQSKGIGRIGHVIDAVWDKTSPDINEIATPAKWMELFFSICDEFELTDAEAITVYVAIHERASRSRQQMDPRAILAKLLANNGGSQIRRRPTSEDEDEESDFEGQSRYPERF